LSRSCFPRNRPRQAHPPPGQGQWRSKGKTQSGNIAVIEVTDQLELKYWKSLRERLESELSQEEVVMRAQEIRQL
jgi:hypothetical protein